MDPPREDDRSGYAIAWGWATRIIALAATLVVPALIGAWIGQKFGTIWTIVLLLLGFVIGATGATMQLMQIAKDSESVASSKSKRNRPPS